MSQKGLGKGVYLPNKRGPVGAVYAYGHVFGILVAPPGTAVSLGAETVVPLWVSPRVCVFV